MPQPVSRLDRQTQLWFTYKDSLVVPRTRLKFGEHAFNVAVLQLSNELLSNVRKASTLATFKRHLKISFSKHYGMVLEQ